MRTTHRRRQNHKLWHNNTHTNTQYKTPKHSERKTKQTSTLTRTLTLTAVTDCTTALIALCYLFTWIECLRFSVSCVRFIVYLRERDPSFMFDSVIRAINHSLRLTTSSLIKFIGLLIKERFQEDFLFFCCIIDDRYRIYNLRYYY